MRTICCPFCHIVLALKNREPMYALYQCPACGYTVALPLLPPSVVCLYWREIKDVSGISSAGRL